MTNLSEDSSKSSQQNLRQEAEKEISRCAVELLRKEPFFGHVLAGLQRHFTDSVDTLGVGLREDALLNRHRFTRQF